MGNVIGVRLRGDAELRRKLERLQVDVGKVLEAATLAAAQVIEDAAEARAPGPNIDHDVVERGQKVCRVQVGPDKAHWYYRFAEFGAGPHAITSRRRRALAFAGAEGVVVTKRVEHPGRAAAPFLRPAVDEHGDEAMEAHGEVLRQPILAQCAGGG